MALALLETADGLVADMDGVLWRGDAELPGAADLLRYCQSRDLPFLLATNNASKRPEAYVERLAGMGVSVPRDAILTSALATAAYLAQRYPERTPVYVVGGPGLAAALDEAGFELLPDAGAQAELVVAGIDFDLTYDKLADAALQIRRGARFVGTNGDLTYPAEAGLLPGAGTVLAAIRAATGAEPTVIGKPEPAMFEIALERLATSPERTVMVGDRLDTDILGAQRAGMRTVLVATGVDDAESAADASIVPDLIVDDLPQLLALWTRSAGEQDDPRRR